MSWFDRWRAWINLVIIAGWLVSLALNYKRGNMVWVAFSAMMLGARIQLQLGGAVER
jgi:uncharacterized membrane protein YfcA